MKKIVRLGTVKTYNGRNMSVFAKIEFDGKRLSISGVEGPTATGNAMGGSGQIDMSYKTAEQRAEISPAPGWTPELIGQFFDTWGKWHLNDMRASCEHQRALGWNPSKEITLYHFRLKREIEAERRAAEQRATSVLLSGDTLTPLPREVEVMNLQRQIVHTEAVLPEAMQEFYEPNGPQYEGDYYNKASEQKTAGWVNEKEHPEGILSKPCPECGYKYGNAWLVEDVPGEVIAFLESLPDTDIKPNWV
jgi:hypothetical protein